MGNGGGCFACSACQCRAPPRPLDPSVPLPLCRLGKARNTGRWSDEETESLRRAVAEYLAARAGAEAAQGPGEGEATLTLADIEGAPVAACRLPACPACCLLWTLQCPLR